jgi:putative tryptophan/tyrosine transport system substrate-binding protein
MTNQTRRIAARVRKDAEELVALAPDVLVAGIGPTTAAFQEATRTQPIVFTQAVDPGGSAR